jgi:hypothetical protein
MMLAWSAWRQNAAGFLVLSEVSQTDKDGLQQRPHVNTLALTYSPFFTPDAASRFLLPLVL